MSNESPNWRTVRLEVSTQFAKTGKDQELSTAAFEFALLEFPSGRMRNKHCT